MKIFSLEQRDKRLTPLEKIFKELNLPSLSFFSNDNFSAQDLKGVDLFIFPHWTLGHILHITKERGEAIKNFVKRGGICWIMSQRQRGDYSFLFPSSLRLIDIENKYTDLDAYPSGRKPYICPWILKREHSIFNKPNYIDEGDFLFWDLRIDNEIYRVSATHIVYLPDAWQILAGYADQRIKLEDKASLIAEAKYGKGLFFWTQTFSPEITYKKERGFTKKFLQNILIYFKDFEENKVFKVKMEPEPWSILSGEKIRIKVKPKEKIKSIDLKILTPKGNEENVKGIEYIPEEGGTYRIRAKITAEDGRFTFAHTFFKVTKGLTPFRFLTHTHFQIDWSPEHLGTLFGACRRLNIDGVVLATGLFYGDEKFYLGAEDIKEIDNPAVRFFIGEEIHCMHNYTLKEGGARQFDNRRHATTVGCITYPYTREYWHPNNLVKVHKKKGIAIVAHPGSQPWWIEPQNNHTFEAVEFDRTNPKIWDKMLREREFISGVSGVDNLGPNRLFFPASPNIGWFDKPFNLNSIIGAILKGRVTKIATQPISYSRFDVEDCFSILKKEIAKGKNNILWFDINNQFSGGTLYATDKVKLNIKAKSSFPIKVLRVVKDGNRNYRKIKINNKTLGYSKVERINENTYYRIEIDSGGCLSLTNPIFIRKVKGPKDSYFYFQNMALFYFNKEKGRFIANLTQLKGIKFYNNIWEISFFDEGEGKIFIGGKTKEIELDGRKVKYKREKGEMAIHFLKGVHKVRIKV